MFRKERSPLRLQSVVLQTALMLLAAMALAATDWADHLSLIPLAVLVGGLTGALIGHSRIGSTLSTVMVLVFGLHLNAWLFGLTLEPSYTMHERAMALLGRMGIFLQVVGGGLKNQDPLPVVMLLGLVYWIFAAAGAYRLVRRRDIIAAIVPAGIALLVIVHYYIGPLAIHWMLGFYIAIALLLALDSDVIQREKEWRKRGARVAPQTVGPIMRAGAASLLLIVFLAWAGPAFAGSPAAASAWRRATSPFTFMRERIADALSSFRSAATIVTDEFGDRLTLEAGTEPGDDLIMEVSPQNLIAGSGRFYWRARVHETYRHGEWQDLARLELDYLPGSGEGMTVANQARELVEITYAPLGSIQHILYLPSQPLHVSRRAEFEVIPGSTGDVAAVFAARPVYPGETYRAEAAISVATADELRRAGEQYPDWVIERYLQVPDEISDRTIELADIIAGGQPTPYDKAAAVTSWLRRNIEYQRVTIAPPPGREPLDWFLFEYQIGFCNYYASAEVIMLRSLGVPARLAVGYARGRYVPNQLVYEVRSEDYHAWPEVYFPGYGWVEFEPTVSQPPLIRPTVEELDESEGSEFASGSGGPAGPAEIDMDRLEELLTEDLPDGEGLIAAAGGSRRLLILGLAALALAAGALLWIRMDPLWRVTSRSLAGLFRIPSQRSAEAVDSRHLGSRSMVEHVYRAWLAWWPRLGLRSSADQTPRERADLFAKSFPEAPTAVYRLAEVYELERFGGQPALGEEAGRIWLSLRPHLWRALLRRLAAWFAFVLQQPVPDPAARSPVR